MSVSSKRRGPVRQLSLQQSQPGRRPLRKQSSEEGLRVLGEAPSVVRSRLPARPVRLAWSEKRQLSCDETFPQPVEVGVVVQRVRGLPRPVTAKPARVTPPPPSILYSRQQLAERLRLAWRDRQQRPNLDIFLAHNSDRLEEEPLLSVREIITEVEKNSLHATDETPRHKYFINKPDKCSDSFGNTLITQSRDELSARTLTLDTCSLESCRECTDSGEETAVEDSRKPKQTPSIKISFDHVSDCDREGDISSVQESVDLHLLSPSSYVEPEEHQQTDKKVEEESEDRYVKIKEPDKPKPDTLTATMRRANFRNSSNNPVMSGSMGNISPQPPMTPPAKPILKKPSQPLPRMMSAPAVGRSAPPRGDLRTPDILECDDEDDMKIVQRERNIKSAPARRRFKNMRRKGAKGHEDDSSEGETLEDTLPPKARPRKRVVERAADIVTMVSLLSPTESEVEDTPPVIQLPQEPVRLPVSESDTKPESTTTNNNTNLPSTAAAASSIVCLRKFATKTVSFQQPGARSYTASYPSRRGVLILPPPEPPAPPPLSTAPPPPLTLNRRRLVRAKSAGATLCQENSCDSEPLSGLGDGEVVVPPSPPPVSVPTQHVTTTTPTDPEAEEDPNAEPNFKTDKERECWQMFRKMADKGVTVSYDTVLRGMLTPTEYRLHKKSLSSTC